MSPIGVTGMAHALIVRGSMSLRVGRPAVAGSCHRGGVGYVAEARGSGVGRGIRGGVGYLRRVAELWLDDDECAHCLSLGMLMTRTSPSVVNGAGVSDFFAGPLSTAPLSVLNRAP